MEYVRCISHLCFSIEFNASFLLSCVHVFLFVVVYCCRGILLIFSYYNVRRMFVASRICACIMQFAFEFNASVFYHLCMYYSFEFNASFVYHLRMHYQLSSLFLSPIYHISPCKSQYHSYYSFPFHGARVVRAFSFFQF